MTGRNLWYVRRGEKVAGPFPSQVITNHALLGRVKPSDEVSMDQLVWQPLVEVRELLPQELLELHVKNDPEQRLWREERLKAARRWADERTHDERRDCDETSEHRGDERRRVAGDPDVLAMPHHHHAPAPESGKRSYLIAGMVVSVLLLLVVLGLVYLQPVNPVKVGVIPAQPQCQQAPVPGINWGGCDKHELRLRGVDLSGGNLSYTNFVQADLSGSRLRQASLVGANLSRADLNDTDLEGADLSYADLHGANLVSVTLKGANLEHAIWTDGRVCAAGSLGQCR